MSADDLAARQEALVRALVAGEELPAGFDADRVGAAARALLNKRAGEVTRAWPQLYGERFVASFRAWAAGRPTQGSWRDGWEYARAHRAELGAEALTALAICEGIWVHGEVPRRRRLPAVRRVPGGAVVTAIGRVAVLRR